MAPSSVPSQQFDWQSFLELSGPDGRDWLVDFRRREHAALADKLNGALRLLHQRNPRPARQYLREAEDELNGLSTPRRSVVHVLRRMYHGVLSYYFYCLGEFPEASAELDVAHECVRHAVASDRVLLLLTIDCSEFCLHKARIARNQRLWGDMRRHIVAAEDMNENRSPLCTLPDGTAVTYHTLASYVATLPLSAEASDAVAPLADVDQRRRTFDSFVLQIYLLPGFVIPYQPFGP